MTMWIKGVVAALALAGSAFIATEPAQARVSVGIGIGVGPGPGYRQGYSPYCDRYSRWFDPYRCDAEYYDGDYYDGPIFIDGFWFDGGHYRTRWHHHRRDIWWHNRWRGDWRGGHGHGHHHGHHGHHW